MPTGLFDLHGGRVGLFPAQGFGEVSGVLGGKAAGGRKTGRTFGVAQGVTLWRAEEGRGGLVVLRGRYRGRKVKNWLKNHPDRRQPKQVAACRPKCTVSRQTAHLAALMLRPTVKR